MCKNVIKFVNKKETISFTEISFYYIFKYFLSGAWKEICVQICV